MPDTSKLTAKGLATRARILAVAADLIQRHGIAATGLEDIRKAADVSGSQMTHYFQDKSSLVKDVVHWQADNTLKLHRMEELHGFDSFTAWRRWAELLVERQIARECRGGCDFGSLAGQLVESGEEIRSDLAEGYAHWIALFRSGIAAMRDRGDLRPEADPEALSHVLLGAMQGGMLLTQTTRRTEPLQNTLDAAIAHLESYATDVARSAGHVG